MIRPSLHFTRSASIDRPTEGEGDTIMANINEEKLNIEIRKFLKNVGVTSQREIEKAIRAAAESGTLGTGGVDAKITLEVPGLDLVHVVEHHLSVS
jgi:hypothetical protein